MTELLSQKTHLPVNESVTLFLTLSCHVADIWGTNNEKAIVIWVIEVGPELTID